MKDRKTYVLASVKQNGGTRKKVREGNEISWSREITEKREAVSPTHAEMVTGD
jgi:hypothetical protein